MKNPKTDPSHPARQAAAKAAAGLAVELMEQGERNHEVARAVERLHHALQVWRAAVDAETAQSERGGVQATS